MLQNNTSIVTLREPTLNPNKSHTKSSIILTPHLIEERNAKDLGVKRFEVNSNPSIINFNDNFDQSISKQTEIRTLVTPSKESFENLNQISSLFETQFSPFSKTNQEAPIDNTRLLTPIQAGINTYNTLPSQPPNPEPILIYDQISLENSQSSFLYSNEAEKKKYLEIKTSQPSPHPPNINEQTNIPSSLKKEDLSFPFIPMNKETLKYGAIEFQTDTSSPIVSDYIRTERDNPIMVTCDFHQ
ncbi:hypothetical protein HMI55_005343 [Coelomomyces lativittatus]|nr:hypothetical protein HMI55_005343 [Coelomomyces lativittatus]